MQNITLFNYSSYATHFKAMKILGTDYGIDLSTTVTLIFWVSRAWCHQGLEIFALSLLQECV